MAIHQCDVKNAYLNSHLKDNITLYSELPPKNKYFHKLSPELKNKPRVVSRWFISIYDSKKGATTGITKSKTFFLGLSYSIFSTDEAVFYKLEDDKITIVTTATDDFSIFADSMDIAKFLIQIISRSPT